MGAFVFAPAAGSVASAGDAAALLQTESRVRSGPAEKESSKDDFKKKEKDNTAMFRPGEEAEVIALEGSAVGQWLPCTVLKQERGGTFTISLTDMARNIPGVPVSALRKVAPPLDVGKDIADGVLLFWAVGSKDYTIDLVMQNIDHLRKTYKGRADVYLAHYDGQQDIWLNRDEGWYKKNVQFSGFKNWKIKRSRPSGFPPQLILAQEFLPEVIDKRQYRWVWLLDEAVDFRHTNMTQLFEEAFATKSLIAAPTVKLANRTGEENNKIAYGECDPFYTACKVHSQQAECSYRYVNFIDMMFPLIHPRALMEIYNSCSNCMQQIDHVWCLRSARLLKRPQDEACAILDNVYVGHANSLSLKKATVQVNASEGDARSSYKEDWVDGDKIKTLQCVKSDDQLLGDDQLEASL